MAQYTEREWTQTKDTEQLTFIAGVNLPYRELVKESGPNTNIMVVATTVDAIGYVLSPKGAIAGEKVDIQMLSGGTGAAPGTSVLTTNSVVGDGTLGNEIQLENDDAAPGPDEYYGTDAGGVKGYHPLPTGGTVASLLEDVGPQQNQWQWDNGAGQTGTLILDNKFENAIHVAKNGNDTLALQTLYQPFSTKVPFLTIEAAFNASTPNNTIVVWPGKYTMVTSLLLDGNHSTHIHCLPGVTITNSTTNVLDSIVSSEFWWTGHAQFNVHNPVYINSSGQYSKLHLEADKALNDNIGGNNAFMSLQNLEFNIQVREVALLGFDCTEWNKGFIGIDIWSVVNESLFTFNTVSSLYDTLGEAHIILGGKTTEKALITRTQPSGLFYGIDLPAVAQEYYKRKLEMRCDVDWMDGYFLNHNNGTVLWKGNAIHRKSDLLGNELPLYSSTTPSFAGQVFKPYFEHWGNIVTDSVEVDQPKLFNNTIVDIRIAGSFILHSTMQCSGQDVGIGAFSCVSISNADLDGTTNVVFDGIFKTGRAADVGPIKINELGNSLNNPLKIQFLDTLAICENSEKTVGPIYSTSATNIPIYLYAYHSLGMTGPFDPGVFSIGLSVDNSYYDTSVSYEVMDYKGP